MNQNYMHVLIQDAKNVKAKKETNDSIMTVIACVCSEHFGVSLSDIRSKSRKTDIRNARQVCIYFMRKHGMMLEYIAKYFSQDHSTTIHSVNVVTIDAQMDGEKRRELLSISVLISTKLND